MDNNNIIMDNNNIILYQIATGEFLISNKIRTDEILIRGTIMFVMSQVQGLLSGSDLDLATDATLEEVAHDSNNIATIGDVNAWLMIYNTTEDEYFIFKNPTGTTQTIHQTFTGSLPALVQKLYQLLMA